MARLDEFLASIENEANQEVMRDIFRWLENNYPALVPVIKWNQPMFTDHGTYIIGFSVAKGHFAFAPETVTIHRFADAIKRAGYSHTDNIVKVKWGDPLDYTLLAQIIDFNILDKADTQTFWR